MFEGAVCRVPWPILKMQRWTKHTSYFLPPGQGDALKHKELRRSGDCRASGQGPQRECWMKDLCPHSKQKPVHRSPLDGKHLIRPLGFQTPWALSDQGGPGETWGGTLKDTCPEPWATPVTQPVSRHHHPSSSLEPVFVPEAQDLTLSSPLLSNRKTPHGPFRSHARKLPLLIMMK